jgi:hypothetical protein
MVGSGPVAVPPSKYNPTAWCRRGADTGDLMATTLQTPEKTLTIIKNQTYA